MMLDQPQSSLDYGEGGKQAQYDPWVVFAHELGHAVKHTQAQLNATLGDMNTVQRLFIQDVRILDKLGRQLRAIPYIHEDGTIDTAQITLVKDAGINLKRQKSCVWKREPVCSLSGTCSDRYQSQLTECKF